MPPSAEGIQSVLRLKASEHLGCSVGGFDDLLEALLFLARLVEHHCPPMANTRAKMTMPAIVPPNVANMLMPIAFTFRLQKAVGCAPRSVNPAALTANAPHSPA